MHRISGAHFSIKKYLRFVKHGNNFSIVFQFKLIKHWLPAASMPKKNFSIYNYCVVNFHIFLFVTISLHTIYGFYTNHVFNASLKAAKLIKFKSISMKFARLYFIWLFCSYWLCFVLFCCNWIGNKMGKPWIDVYNNPQLICKMICDLCVCVHITWNFLLNLTWYKYASPIINSHSTKNIHQHKIWNLLIFFFGDKSLKYNFRNQINFQWNPLFFLLWHWG